MKKYIKRQPGSLVEKIESIREKLKTQQRAMSELEKGKLEAINKELKEVYFKDLPFEGASGYSDYSHIYFKLKRPGDKYLTEICSITIRKSDYQLKRPDQIGLSYYSTTDVSDFEINRLIILGKIAQVVKDHGDAILETIEEIVQPYKNIMNPLRKAMWKAESNIGSLQNEINDVIHYKATRKLFKEGFEFEDGRECIYVRNDYRVCSIKKVKFLDWTNDNRKSLTVELTRKVQTYGLDEKTGLYKYFDEEDRVEIHSKVRTFNISHIIEKVKEELRNELVADKVEEALEL